MVSDNAPEAYEVYWAALRSGLYITAVNHHLSASEAAYIVDDCGAKALVVSAAKSDLVQGMADLVDVPVPARLRRRRPRLRVVRRRAGRREHRAAGRPAARRRLPLLLGHDRAAEGDQAAAAADPGRRGGLPLRDDLRRAVRLRARRPSTSRPAPVYHAAPLRYTGVIQALGGTVVLMQRFEPEAFLEAVQKYAVTDTQVRPDDVRADAQAARGGAGVVRHLEPEDRRARGGAVPGRGQAADDRVARPDRARVLRQHRGQRRDVRRAGGLAGAPRHRRPVAARHAADLRPRRARSCRRARSARSTSSATTSRSPTTATRTRPRPRGTRSTRSGRRSATSATSTTRATCS